MLHDTLHLLGYLMFFFLQYAVLFTIYANIEGVNDPLWLFLAPFMVLFAFQNFLIHVFALTIAFLDPPREWSITERLKRYKNYRAPEGIKAYRRAVAYKICCVLNVFDPEHC